MNTTQLIGNVTKDLQLNYSKSGTAYVNFTLAVQRKFKNQQGEREADFIRLKAFKKAAEILAQYVGKGSKLGVTGSIQTGSYQNKEGQTVFTTDVIVNEFDFLDSKGQSQPNNQQKVDTYNQEVNKTLNSEAKETHIDDSSLPF